MAIEIRLPALGQTADEMEILSWLKQIGDPRLNPVIILAGCLDDGLVGDSTGYFVDW